MFSNFVRKWSDHDHIKDCSNCDKALVYDGNWKITRSKCAFDQIYVNSPEFGDIQVGCLATPARGSYFCHNHKGAALSFEVDGVIQKIAPENIHHTEKSK